MNIIISGAAGFMGREVAKQAEQAGVQIAFGVDAVAASLGFPVFPSFEAAPPCKDAVIIDFSRPEVLEGMLTYAKANGLPLIVATTGYTQAQMEMLQEAAKTLPVFQSGNLSLGIAVLRMMAKKAASILGSDYDVEIIEAHHHRKVDAPSGTAKMIYQSLCEGYEEERTAVYGRSGNDCKRQPQEIGIHAVRGGTVTGEHQVCFFGPSERITISHSAENRALFATGALRAAQMIVGKPAGMYDMEDVVSV